MKKISCDQLCIKGREGGDFELFITLVPKFFNNVILILIYRRDNLVYHYWECTSIYRPMSYIFRFLDLISERVKLCPKKNALNLNEISKTSHERNRQFLKNFCTTKIVHLSKV